MARPPREILEELDNMLGYQPWSHEIRRLLHEIIEDVNDSWYQTLTDFIPNEDAEGALTVVQDYIVNHYGDD